MKKTMLILVRAVVCLVVSIQSVHGQSLFEYPANRKGLPVDYLEQLKVQNPSRQLTTSEKHDLARLFIKAYVISKRIHKLDYLLNPQVPVYQLFKTNFPGIEEREGEGGIFLGEIARFLNKMPEYRADVEQVLREGPSRNGRCGI